MLAFKGQRAFSYLKISVPCGCRPKARQIRWTPEVEIPLDRASLTSSNGQCPVASLPGCDDHRLDFGIVDRTPRARRGSSWRPSNSCATKRARHLHTVLRRGSELPRNHLLGLPRAGEHDAGSQRQTKAWWVVRRPAMLRRVSSSVSLTHDLDPMSAG